MTTGAAVQIETRTETVPDALRFQKGVTASLEERLLPGRERREIVAGSGGSSTNPGIVSKEELSLSRTREKDRQTDHEE